MSLMKRMNIMAGMLLGVIWLSGCLERKETITIREDGSIKFAIAHSSESWDDMYLGDAWPRLEGGWFAESSSVVDQEGKETFHLTAEMTLPAEAQLPADYEIPLDPYPATSAKFPTSLTMERRNDGTYYHFKRTYAARKWAYIAALREEIKERLGLNAEALQPVGKDNPQRQRTELRALAEYEIVKLEKFAGEALKDVQPDLPQDVFLAVRAALLEQSKELDFELLMELIAGAEDDPMFEEELAEEAEEFEVKAMDAIARALREGGYLSGSKTREFFRRFEWHQVYFQVTEDLADDAFMITIVMPGEIIGHNGDKASGSSVTWEFTGERFRDRDYDLMVTSRVR